MARANLNIQQNVIDRFLAAQETRNVRVLKIKIHDEDLVLDTYLERQSTASSDFNDQLPTILADNEACFALFCLTDDENGALSWLLVAWVPDGCRVRDKMLYSSSREDLKRRLGLGYFKLDYGISLREEVNWQLYQESTKRVVDQNVLTENERLVMEEKALTQSETSTSKSSALGVIPFETSTDVLDKFNEFKEGSTNWIDMSVENEVIQLLGAKSIGNDDALSAHVRSDIASFIATKLTKEDGQQMSFFIFSCPENVPVRSKMTMSSCKASVLAAAAQQGITFDKLLEIRDTDEIDDLVKTELNPSAHSATTSSSSAASLSHNKPQRPGRGKAKVSKFQANEE